MNPEAVELWGRALRALKTAETIPTTDPDAVASRTYYAAFYAASAWLAERGLVYSKHSAVEGAVHRDLVKPGLIPVTLGAHYSWLNSLRNTGDYGGLLHVSREDAEEALLRTREFVGAIAALLGISV